ERRFTLDDAMPIVQGAGGRIVGLLRGRPATAIDWAVEMRGRGIDARIIAFRNEAVQHYNAEVHRRIYGETASPFSPGEHVVAHEQFDAWQVLSDHSVIQAGVVVNSEEMVVCDISDAPFPHYPAIPAWRLALALDTGEKVGSAFVPHSPAMVAAANKANW
ncbi:hypothetical protein B1B_17627, partial [mine drainage metagenome]